MTGIGGCVLLACQGSSEHIEEYPWQVSLEGSLPPRARHPSNRNLDFLNNLLMLQRAHSTRLLIRLVYYNTVHVI